MGGPGGLGGADVKSDFSSPMKAVQSFLSAVKAKNPELIAESVAQRAPLEATAKNRKMFSAIIEQSLPGEELTTLASEFEGYQVVGQNLPKSTGSLGVTISKSYSRNNFQGRLSRTLTVRKERGEWKVVDVGGIRDTLNPTGKERN